MPSLRRDQYLAIAKTLPASNKTKSTVPSSSSAATKANSASIPTSTTTVEPVQVPQENSQEIEVAAAEEGEDGDEQEDGDWEDVDSDEEDVNANAAEAKLGPNISIFDDKELASVDECVEYMAQTFGFFLPDSEYLVDLEGMLEYLGEKVKLGCICLYCQKRFASGRACQHHMKGKAHCKIAYEEGVDSEEFEDFYDFSTSYENLDKVELDENGDVIQEEVEVASTGELILPDGRIIGHRNFRVYYKQYYRPEDTRAPVLAQQREELLRLGLKYGGNKAKASELANLSDTEVMSMLVKYHKQIRKSQIVEQSAMKRRESADMRHEYKSKLHKLRSSATTTEKIRDYHRIL